MRRITKSQESAEVMAKQVLKAVKTTDTGSRGITINCLSMTTMFFLSCLYCNGAKQLQPLYME